MTTKSRTPYVSNYASHLYTQSPEEYKLFIQAKVESRNGLGEILRQAHLYKVNNPDDDGIKKVIQRLKDELKYGYPDGACMHPEIYKTKMGSKWSYCACCRSNLYK